MHFEVVVILSIITIQLHITTSLSHTHHSSIVPHYTQLIHTASHVTHKYTYIYIMFRTTICKKELPFMHRKSRYWHTLYYTKRYRIKD